MIHELDQSLENLIYEQGKINRSEIDISFEIPNGDWSARLSRPTIDLWCFDIRENLRLRNADLSSALARRERTARISAPPRRFDLCYLVTAWVRKVEDEHQLLWRVLTALMQVPLLTPEMGVGAVRDQEFDIPLVVANMPEFQVSITDLWSVVNNQMRLGFILTATVALDTGRGIEVPLVFEKSLEFGQTPDPLQREIATPDGSAIVQKANSKPKESEG